MAPAGFSGRRRQFDVACGVLSRCVKAQAVAPVAPTMLLMPGADVTPDVREEEPEAAAATTTTPLAQLTIMYGDRVLVLDDFPSYRVAELLLLAERPDVAGGTTTADDDIPVPRTASLQRFMEKRRDRRLAARAPYGGGGGVLRGPAPASSSSNKERNQSERDDAGSSWLGLGVPGRSSC